MQNKMLIDASHPEETRVIVLRGNRVEEFDFESANKKQLRGNIYLAKVTRVEPSLQAAFVDYGGNRHGFLAFSEIHPDYYQIPVADRQALLEEEARAERAEEDDEGRTNSRRRGRRRHVDSAKRRHDEAVRSGSADAIGESGAGQELLPDDEGTSAAAAAGEETPDAGDQMVVAPSTQETGPAHGGAVVPAELPLSETGLTQESAAEAEGGDAAAAADDALGEETPAVPIADGSGLEAALAVPTGSEASQSGRGDALAEALPELPSSGGTAPVGLGTGAADDQGSADHAETAALSPEPAELSAEPFDAAEDAGERSTARREPGDESASENDEDEQDEDEDEDGEAQQVEQLGGDAMEEVPSRPYRPRRHYKIQEVIKRRQVLLVQVVKEERGTKGAALTTYLSLAGRYSVLMPNTARGGGISRKITDSADRKRLKSIAEDLEVPEGMGIILRTAGATRTKAEVKRDFEYLLRMWETVREVTLKSTAPTLVYEEGSLIKRAIRDLYSKDIEEISVAGEDGYREAKEFMRMLMPSHAKNVQPYRDAQPIFTHAGAEAQLDGMYNNQVTLRSGGYIVINQTEALVAIDVNSGRSTREHNIEDTALRTNLEAADEVARQLRLRDLAGLIVVDFIDMEEGRNNRAVERRMKEALKNDRARIQIGRISHFGLLEMSRQRIRTGVLEGSTVPCPHCMGAGMVRSTSSIALHVLRGLEDALIKNSSFDITVKTRTEVALYILNQKRSHLREIEARFGVTITVAADPSLTGVAYYTLERGELATPQVDKPRQDLVRIDTVQPMYDDEAAATDDEDAEADVDEEAGEAADADGALQQGGGDDALRDGDGRRRRRRRRRRGGRDRERDGQEAPGLEAPQPSDDGLAAVMEIAAGPEGRGRGGAAGMGELPSLEEGEETALPADEMDTEGAAEGAATGEAGRLGATRPVSRRRRSRRGENRRFQPREVELGASAETQGAADGFGMGGETQTAGRAVSENASQPEQAGADDRAASADPAELEHPLQVQGGIAGDGQQASVPLAATDGGAQPAASRSPEVAAIPSAPTLEPERDTGLAQTGDMAEFPQPEPQPAIEKVDEAPRPKRSGWWQRAKATFGG